MRELTLNEIEHVGGGPAPLGLLKLVRWIGIGVGAGIGAYFVSEVVV